MTISTTPRRAGPYATDGVQTAFAFSFKVFSAEDVKVYRSEDGLDTLLALTTDYTVALNADQDASPGGTVTLLVAPNGPVINILSGLAIEQPVVITNQGGFFPRVFNDVFDRLTIYVQQFAEKLDRALLSPLDTTSVVGQYPVVLPGGGYGFSAGTGSDPALRTDLGDGDNAVVAYDQRSVKAKLDDWVTPLDKGAVGDGIADDSPYIEAALATGKHVVIPKGYSFKTSANVGQGHAYTADKQIVEVNGDVLYSGTRHALPGGHAPGFHGIFVARDLERIQIFGSGNIDGAMVRGAVGSGTWGPFSAGDNGSGLFFTRCPGFFVDGVKLTRFINDGIKSVNCPEFYVGGQTYLFDIYNIGHEINSDATDVFNGGIAWVGTTYGPSGKHYAVCELIDDHLHGAGNGCGVDFSSETGAARVQGLTIGGRYLDCLLPVWSENNYPGSEARDVILDDVYARGNIRGAAVAECSDGIGLIGVQGVRGRATIVDQSNFDPPAGAETVGVNVVSCSNVDLDLNISTDTGIANRMQHAAKLSGSTGVKLRGRQSGVTGLSDMSPTVSTPILFDTTASATAENTDVDIAEFDGGAAASNWSTNYGGGDTSCSAPAALVPLKFKFTNLAAAASNQMLTVSGDHDKEVLPCAGRLVGVTAKATNITGTLSIAATVAGTSQSACALTEADFAANVAAKQTEGRDCLQSAAKATVEVIATTTGGDATNDLEVTLWFDPRWKR